MSTKRMREPVRIWESRPDKPEVKFSPKTEAMMANMRSKAVPEPFNIFDNYPYELANTECAYCTKEFKTSEARKQHEDHCSTSELKWTCDDCGKKYKTKKGLTWHQQQHQEPQITYICRGCPSSYKSLSELRKHCYLFGCPFPTVEGPVLEDEVRCDICFKVYKQYSIKYHMEEHQKKSNAQHECEYCDFKTIRKNNLTRHLETVHNVWNINFDLVKKHFDCVYHSSYNCPRCNKVCETYEEAVAHLKLKRCEDENICKICNIKFTMKQNFKAHRKRKHPDE